MFSKNCRIYDNFIILYFVQFVFSHFIINNNCKNKNFVNCDIEDALKFANIFRSTNFETYFLFVNCEFTLEM